MKETFGEVVDKAQKQLSKWNANSLSQVGRFVLIQSKLSTKANFQMQIFLLPTANISSLDKINKSFLWNKAEDSSSLNLIRWNKVCKPKC